MGINKFKTTFNMGGLVQEASDAIGESKIHYTPGHSKTTVHCTGHACVKTGKNTYVQNNGVDISGNVSSGIHNYSNINVNTGSNNTITTTTTSTAPSWTLGGATLGG